MNKAISRIFIFAGLTVLLAVMAFHSTPVIAGGSNGSVDTVSDCSHVNDNQFYVGDTVKGIGSNFDANSDYEWTITKVDQPSQNTQVASGSFTLGSSITSFCYTLWTAAIVGGDTHSEFKWEVDEKNTDNKGNVTWKKVDSDNFFVDPAQTTPTPTQVITPTPTVTTIPTPTPTTDPCADDECITPTSTPSITPTVTVTATPTPTVVPTTITTNTGGNGGGDGLSDGRSSCPQCTEAPQASGQSVLGTSTQAVLGASTMASTGMFTTSLMNILLTFGMMVLGAGAVSYAKEKNK